MNTSRRFSLTLLILLISSCASRLELDRGYSFQDLETGFNLTEIWSDQIYYDGNRLDMVYVMKDNVSLNYFIILASNVKGYYSYTPKFIEDSSKLDPRDSINYSRIEYGHIEYEVDSTEITFQIENCLKIVPKKGQIISGAYDYDGAYGHYLTLEYSADSLKGTLSKAWRINKEYYQFIPIKCDSLYRDSIEIFCSDI